ncbi:MAG TPA: hypothetical protein VLZ89_11490 [Anaerolineales bacterium]|nr:hypothetical protein [Anaerolineales bacterium]
MPENPGHFGRSLQRSGDQRALFFREQPIKRPGGRSRVRLEAALKDIVMFLAEHARGPRDPLQIVAANRI